MDFPEASDRLTHCVTLNDLARACGASRSSIKQARLDPESSGYRSPPEGWEHAIAKLARERAGELEKLAQALEG